jgi:hypothetical protein
LGCNQLLIVPTDHIPVLQVTTKDVESTSNSEINTSKTSTLDSLKVCQSVHSPSIRHWNLKQFAQKQLFKLSTSGDDEVSVGIERKTDVLDLGCRIKHIFDCNSFGGL